MLKKKYSSKNFFKKNINKKKRIVSPLVASILLIVIVVVIIAFVVSWGKDFTNTSLKDSGDIGDLKINDATHFIFTPVYKGTNITFTYYPPKNLKNQEIIIDRYSVKGFDDIFQLNSEISLTEGTVGIKDIDLSSLEINEKKIDIVLYTKNNEIINLRNINYQSTQTTELIACDTGFNDDGDYVLCFADDFDYVRSNLDQNYILGRDIDFFNSDHWNTPPLNISTTTDNWNDGNGFEPIGTYVNWAEPELNIPFLGVFDGNNNTLKNLYINRASESHIALFSYAEDAIIKNLILEDVNIIANSIVSSLLSYSHQANLSDISIINYNITAQDNVGGLIGYGYKTNISDSHTIGNISGSSYLGGLVGRLSDYYSIISNSYSISDVQGVGYYIGGFIGLSENAQISNSYFQGDVNGNEYIGGFIGYVDSHNAPIHNSYAFANVVSVGNNVGGFLGYAYRQDINNCYSVGSVTSLANYIGGLVGYYYDGTVTNSYSATSVDKVLEFNNKSNENRIYFSDDDSKYYFSVTYIGGLLGYKGTGGAVENSYWDVNVSGDEFSSFGEGKTTIEMKQQSTFTGWDFTNIWNIQEGNTYPFLRDNTQDPLPQ